MSMPRAAGYVRVEPVPKSTVCSGASPCRAMARTAISGWGFPKKRGVRPVAVVSIRQTLPQSGTEPYQVGQTQSGLVAQNSAPAI